MSDARDLISKIDKLESWLEDDRKYIADLQVALERAVADRSGLIEVLGKIISLASYASEEDTETSYGVIKQIEQTARIAIYDVETPL